MTCVTSGNLDKEIPLQFEKQVENLLYCATDRICLHPDGCRILQNSIKCLHTNFSFSNIAMYFILQKNWCSVSQV